MGATCHPSARADPCLAASYQTDWDTWDRRGGLGWTRLRLLVCSPGQCRSTSELSLPLLPLSWLWCGPQFCCKDRNHAILCPALLGTNTLTVPATVLGRCCCFWQRDCAQMVKSVLCGGAVLQHHGGAESSLLVLPGLDVSSTGVG